MAAQNQTEPLKIGTIVRIRNSGYGRAKIVEFRGPLGPNHPLADLRQLRRVFLISRLALLQLALDFRELPGRPLGCRHFGGEFVRFGFPVGCLVAGGGHVAGEHGDATVRGLHARQQCSRVTGRCQADGPKK